MAEHRVTREESMRARRRARALLRSPRFFNEFLAALEKDGLVGEVLNALILLIVVVSRLLRRPLRVFVRGLSSSGKNWLVKRVLRLMPRDAYRELTNSSEAAWNYSADEFRHRVIYDQERDDGSRTARQMRLLISEDKLIRLVTQWERGRRITKRYVARGPVASISTTTKNKLEVDDLTRHLSIFTDQSSDQTRQIIKRYTKHVSGLTREELRAWRAVQDLLKERTGIKIAFPDWFDMVSDGVSAGDVSLRRYYPAFVEACRTVCLIRSFQSRCKPKKGTNLEVGFADFAITTLIFDHAFAESLHQQDDSREATRRLVQKLVQREGRGITAKEMAEELGISMDRAYARLRCAERAGTIQRANKPGLGNLKQFVPTPRCRFIPDPKEIFRHLKFKRPIRFVHPTTGAWVEYRGNQK